MFERCTDRARRVLVLAQDEARLLHHNHIGTEHLLLGITAEAEGVGALVLGRLGFDADRARAMARGYPGDGSGLLPGDADVLRSIGIDLDEVRRRVEQAFGPGALERTRWQRRCRPPGRSDGAPFTPRAKKTLELALREALALGHDFIGTEHLLLGLLREGEGLAARMLVDQGIDLDSARAGVLAEVGGGPGAAPRRPGGLRGGPGRGRRGIRHRRPRRAL